MFPVCSTCFCFMCFSKEGEAAVKCLIEIDFQYMGNVIWCTVTVWVLMYCTWRSILVYNASRLLL